MPIGGCWQWRWRAPQARSHSNSLEALWFGEDCRFRIEYNSAGKSRGEESGLQKRGKEEE